MEDRESEKSFKIADRRRFDSSGNLRGEAADAPGESPKKKDEPEEGEAMKSKEATIVPGGAQDPGAEFSEEGGIDFTSFVMSLATQAMVQLGEMPPPQGVQIPVSVEAARQTIDILAMLYVKTKGNLSEQEANLMEEILHSLRVSYVRRT